MTEPPFDARPLASPSGGPATPPGFQPPAHAAGYDTSAGPLAAPRRPLANTQRLLAVAVVVVVLAVIGTIARSVFLGMTEVRQAGPDVVTSVSPGPELPSFEGSFPTARPTAERTLAPAGPVPKPVRYAGTGTKTIRLRKPERGISLIYAKGDATNGRFYVREVDADGVLGQAYLAEFGRFEVLQVFETGDDDPAWGLRVEASGPWTIEIRSARSAPSFARSGSSRRGGVWWYTGPAGIATLTGGADGAGSLVVTAYRPDGSREGGIIAMLLDRDTERVRWPAGRVLVEFDTDVPWSVRVS